LSTTNPTWPDPVSNPGRHGGKPATNRLSYGAAYTETNRHVSYMYYRARTRINLHCNIRKNIYCRWLLHTFKASRDLDLQSCRFCGF
jgi:hypothetical protein